MPRRIKVVAACFLLYGAWSVIWSMSLVYVFLQDKTDEWPLSFATRYLLPPAILFFGTITSVAGIALLRRADWGRPLSILISLLSLLFFPKGTLFGLFALWALYSTAVPPETARLSTA